MVAFQYGGWTVPYFDEEAGQVMAKQMSEPFELLLGRKTFDIFASYWPQHAEDWPGINQAAKYVASRTLRSHEWENSIFLNDDVVTQINNSNNKMVQTYRCMGAVILSRPYSQTI